MNSGKENFVAFFLCKLFIRKEKKTIKLDPTRSFAAPFVGFAFKIEVCRIDRFIFIIYFKFRLADEIQVQHN